MRESVDAFLDRQAWRDAVRACIDPGVTERPPQPNVRYAAFAVHPPRPGNLLALAIGHRAADKFVIDAIRDNISVADSVAVLWHYGITDVTGQVGDEADDALAHAVAGCISLLAGDPQ